MNETKVRVDEKAGIVYIPTVDSMEGITFEAVEKLYSLVSVSLGVRRIKRLKEGQIEK